MLAELLIKLAIQIKSLAHYAKGTLNKLLHFQLLRFLYLWRRDFMLSFTLYLRVLFTFPSQYFNVHYRLEINIEAK